MTQIKLIPSRHISKEKFSNLPLQWTERWVVTLLTAYFQICTHTDAKSFVYSPQLVFPWSFFFQINCLCDSGWREKKLRNFLAARRVVGRKLTFHSVPVWPMYTHLTPKNDWWIKNKKPSLIPEGSIKPPQSNSLESIHWIGLDHKYINQDTSKPI